MARSRALCALLAIGVLPVLPASAQASTCPNEQFRSGPSALLPDCRAYELVTPPLKNGGRPTTKVMSASGQSLTTTATSAWNAATEGDGYIGEEAVYHLQRTATGWTTVSLFPPTSEYETFSPISSQHPLAAAGFGGGETLWVQRGRSLPPNELDIYLEPAPGAPLRDIGPITPPDAPIGTAEVTLSLVHPQIVGVSEDLSHVLFEQGPSAIGEVEKPVQYKWPFDETDSQRESLYEYVGVASGAQLRSPALVGLSDGKTIVPGENGGQPLPAGQLISQCGTVLGAANPESNVDLFGLSGHDSVSADGKTVFFTALAKAGVAGEECTSPRAPLVSELYAQIEQGPGEYETVAISEPTQAACALCDTSTNPGVRQEGRFVAGSADGSKVFFETTQPLLGDGTSNNLYEYDLDGAAGARVVRVSGGDATVSDPIAEVQRVLTSSEDGSHVYFLAHGVLTKTPNEFGQTAQPGAENLYVFDTQTGSTQFIATGAGEGQATPDGRYLVFTNSTPLTTPDDTGTHPQLFEYDAGSGSHPPELVRISAGRDGYSDNGNGVEASISLGAAENTPNAGNVYAGNISSATNYWEHLAISENGSYVVFNAGALTPRGEGIYEYHSVGPISDGSLAFIFPGGLIGMDASGEDIFFSTEEQLVPQDTDTQLDVYDARIDGGFPPPPVLDECAGEECQGKLSATPVLLAPGSAFQAGGNPPLAAPGGQALNPQHHNQRPRPRGCKKGFVKQKTRCVKQHKAKPRKRARKSSRDRRTSR